MIAYSQWCRIEGTIIPDLDKEYGVGTLKNLNQQKIFYGTPEIEINNPSSTINGCKYRVIPISGYGWSTIQEIDTNYNELLNKIQQENKNSDLGVFFHRPFVINESSIILHNDSTKDTLDIIAFVWVDKYAVPEIKKIMAYYNNTNVRVDEDINTDNLTVTAIYSDSTTALIQPTGYKIFNDIGNESSMVTKVGSNTFTVSYTSNDKTFTATFVVPGIKKLTGVTGLYDGPTVGYGQTVTKKYFVISAIYSDGSSSAVTDFTFPDGMVVTKENNGMINVFYKGFLTSVLVKTFDVVNSKLVASYNGPNVEVGNELKVQDIAVRIYYEASDAQSNYFEDVNPNDCTVMPTRISHEGTNYITISYHGKLGTISSQFSVNGIKANVVLSYITASYSGPDITVGEMFDITKIICKGYYSNGSIVLIKNFLIFSNIVSQEGDNEYIVGFDGKETTVVIRGIPKEDTTNTSFNEIKIDNQYPSGTIHNHRYRGPAESIKAEEFIHDVIDNLNRLYDRFKKLEGHWNIIIDAESKFVQSKENNFSKIRNIINEARELKKDE